MATARQMAAQAETRGRQEAMAECVRLGLQNVKDEARDAGPLIRVTLYLHPAGQTTASGTKLRPGLDAAVSPALETVIPLGSRVRVEGKPSKARDGLWAVLDRTKSTTPGLVLDLSHNKGSDKFAIFAVLDER